jgi:hypothetical protein
MVQYKKEYGMLQEKRRMPYLRSSACMRWKSWLRNRTAFCPAAKWALTKRKVVSHSRKVTPIPPLLPSCTGIQTVCRSADGMERESLHYLERRDPDEGAGSVRRPV